MKVMFLLLTLLAADAPDIAWQPLPDLPLGVFNAAASTRGDDLIVTGGLNQAGSASTHVQVYHADRNAWTDRSLLDPPRCNHVQVTLDAEHVLIVAGQTGGVREGFTDLTSGAIINLETGGSEPIPDLPRSAGGPTGHRLPGGNVVVIGHRSAAVFDPALRQWVKFIDLRQSRKWHGSALLTDGRILVAGGQGRRTLELIDVDAGVSQMQSAKLPDALDDLAVEPLPDGRAMILAGQRNDTGETVDGTWVYDPATGALAPAAPLGIDGGVADHATAVNGPWLFSAGGESESSGHDKELAAARIVDMRSLRVWSLPDMSAPHDDAVALPWRRGVVVIGGFRYARGPFGMRIPAASRTVETLQLPAEAFE